MIRFTDLTDEQLQSCFPAGVDLERFKRIAVTTEKFVDEMKCYLISDQTTASIYCREILSTISSAEHTPEWETEFNSHYSAVSDAGHAVNALLSESQED
jgi:hypothetical protein